MSSSDTIAAEPPPGPHLLASRAHTVILIAITIGIAWTGAAGSSQVSADPRRSHVAQYVVLLTVEWLLFYYVWRGLHRAGTPLGEVIGRRWSAPREAWKVVCAAALFYGAKQLVLGALQAGMAAAGFSRTAESHRTMALMAPHGVLEVALWIMLSISAGFVEETVYRGYLQRQLGAWMRHIGLGIAASAVLFGVAHGYQGPLSVVLISAYGALFGVLAHVTRTLRPGIVAHAFEDLLSGLLGGR
jgi:CAAX protease family protein